MKYTRAQMLRSTATRLALCSLSIPAVWVGSFRGVHGEVRDAHERPVKASNGNPVLQWFHPDRSGRARIDSSAPSFCAPPGEGPNKNGGKPSRAQRKKERRNQVKRLAEKYVPDGNLSIMKPGAIKGTRTMDNPWTVETNHYIVKTDISRKASGEIALIMEMFFNAFVQSDIFQIDRMSYEKLPVIVPKNRTEFLEILAKNGIERVRSHIKGYYIGKSEDRKMLAYYFYSKDTKLHNMLLSVGTRQFLDLVMKSEVPAWLEEGLVMYFETSRFRGWKLHGGGVKKERLRTIRRYIRRDVRFSRDRVEDLSVLMRKNKKQFDGGDSAQAWSLVHFLIHWKNGRLAGKLRKYLSTYKREGVQKDPVRLFRNTFGFSPEKLRNPWQNYVFQLR